MQDTELENAYRYCENVVRNHYENFPVASWFLPQRIRRPIAVIYAFARNADDFADEGDLTNDERLANLKEYETRLENLHQPQDDPVFIALADVIQQHKLSLSLLKDLLTAFNMDVTRKRFASFSSVLFYCKHSANPIGRLLLELYQVSEPQAQEHADAVCSALQLINFYQDIEQDFTENNRIYIPSDEMSNYGVTVDHIREKINDHKMIQLIESQVKRAQQMLLSGYPLNQYLPHPMRYELRMIIEAGLLICNKLLAHRDNVFARPRLNRLDWLNIIWRAAFSLSNKKSANAL